MGEQFNKKEYDSNYKKANYKRVSLEISKEQSILFKTVLNEKNLKTQTILKEFIKQFIKDNLKIEDLFKLFEERTVTENKKLLVEVGFIYVNTVEDSNGIIHEYFKNNENEIDIFTDINNETYFKNISTNEIVKCKKACL